MKRSWYRDQYGVKVWVGMTIFVGGFLLLIVGLALSAGYVVDRTSCRQKVEAMGRDYRWGFFSGCLVELNDGSYIPLRNYRISNGEGR